MNIDKLFGNNFCDLMLNKKKEKWQIAIIKLYVFTMHVDKCKCGCILLLYVCAIFTI